MKLKLRLPCAGNVPAVGDEFRIGFGAMVEITKIERVDVVYRSELIDIGPGEKMLVTAYADITIDVPDFEPEWPGFR